MRKQMRFMTNRGASTVTLHAVLAAVALIGAYLTWTRDKTQVQQGDTAVALDAGKRDIEKVVFKDESRTVAVERKSEEGGEPYTWVTITSKKKDIVTHAPSAPPALMGHGAGPGAPAAPAGHGAAPAAPAKAPAPGAAPPAGPAKAVTPVKPAIGGLTGEKAAADKEGERKAPSAPSASASATTSTSTPTPAAAAKPAGGASLPTGPIPTPPGVPTHEVKEIVTTKSFRGNEAADKLLEAFAPLRALRALGKLDQAKLKELGLDAPKKSLMITVKGQELKYDIGNASYGSGDLYVKDPQGQVFLLPSHIASDFEFAESRLMERRLHRFERADISRVEVTVGGKKKVLVQQKRMDPVGYFWADEATPDKRDDALRNWMDKVLRMAINDYVAKGEEPQGPAMSEAPGAGVPKEGEVLSMRFYDGRKEIGHATFSRYLKGTLTEYYATTETTIGLVKLLSATTESAIQDAEKW